MPVAVFNYSHRVVYSDCTVGDHIYYARYLDILEAARGDFFRHLGVSLLEWQGRDRIFPVVECHLCYKSQARYDDTLQIGLWATLAERVRLNLAFRIVNQSGALVLEGETWHACTDLAGKPRRLPEPLRVALQPFLDLSAEPKPHAARVRTESVMTFELLDRENSGTLEKSPEC